MRNPTFCNANFHYNINSINAPKRMHHSSIQIVLAIADVMENIITLVHSIFVVMLHERNRCHIEKQKLDAVRSIAGNVRVE